jgi:endonuclease III
MGSINRSTQYVRVFKILKKSYEPVSPPEDRTVLEHLLFACCLENAHYDAAEEAFAAVVHTFFDLNEIRVSTTTELSEVMSNLPDPSAAAHRLKRVLQNVFEEFYAFDLEAYRKKNLGPTVKWLKKVDGTTNFTVSYVVQAALGGHSIAVDAGVLNALKTLEIISKKEFSAGTAAGLERAITKSKGIEFGSLLHQLGADFTANPYSPAVRKILLEIDPTAKDRLPKRRVAKKKKAASEKSSAKKTAKAPATRTKKKATDAKKAPKKKTTSATAKKTASKTTKKKSTSEGLSKRKPR